MSITLASMHYLAFIRCQSKYQWGMVNNMSRTQGQKLAVNDSILNRELLFQRLNVNYVIWSSGPVLLWHSHFLRLNMCSSSHRSCKYGQITVKRGFLFCFGCHPILQNVKVLDTVEESLKYLVHILSNLSDTILELVMDQWDWSRLGLGLGLGHHM
jgi:hypothetical protein